MKYLLIKFVKYEAFQQEFLILKKYSLYICSKLIVLIPFFSTKNIVIV